MHEIKIDLISGHWNQYIKSRSFIFSACISKFVMSLQELNQFLRTL